MKIRFIGTAASEGFPAIFCECEFCTKARRLKGKNLRTRSSLQIDDEILIDFSADTYAQTLYCGLNLTDVNHLFITHSHGDHFYPNEFYNIIYPKAYYNKKRVLNVYSNSKVIEKINSYIGKYANRKDYEENLNLNLIEDSETVKFNHYSVTAIHADHCDNENCLNYIIQKGDKTVFQAYDTMIFSEETWEKLKEYKFDCVILDCTMLNDEGVFPGHMGFSENVQVKETMLKLGIATEKTIFVGTHFAHMFNPLHSNVDELFKTHGFFAPYDGAEVEI